MTKKATITKQGQISIPASYRKQMGIDGKKVCITIKDNKLIIEPAVDLLDYGGLLADKKLDTDSIDATIAIENRSVREAVSRKANTGCRTIWDNKC